MAESESLDLDQEDAASLYLLLETAIDALAHKRNILDEIFKLPSEERPEEFKDNETLQGVINLNKDLTARAKAFSKDVGQIIIYLEKPQPTILPTPPSWQNRA